jgi:hypothetical protein
MFHKHLWKITGEDIYSSPFEIFIENGGTKFRTHGYADSGWFDKTIIIRYECEKCGEEKVKKL